MSKNQKFRIMILMIILISNAVALPVAAAVDSQLPAVSATAAILIDQDSGRVLYGKQINERMYPASLTKLVTTLVVLQQADLDKTVIVGDEVWKVASDASRVGLKWGDKISLRDLLWAMLLPSGNDAAYTAAVYVARLQNPELTVDEAVVYFADLMNQLAKSLGANDSHFVCPDGYHDDDHYTTTTDLALIAQAAMQIDLIRQIVASQSHVISITRQGEVVQRSLINSNHLLWSSNTRYQMTGLKTGTTVEAGNCLAASATNGDLSLISIVLQDSSIGRWHDSLALLNYGFGQFSRIELYRADEVLATVQVASWWPGWFAAGIVSASEPLTTVVLNGDMNRIKSQIIWDEQRVTISGDTGLVTVGWEAVGQPLGRIVYSLDGVKLAEAPLCLKATALHYRPDLLLLLLTCMLLGSIIMAYLLLHRIGRTKTDIAA